MQTRKKLVKFDDTFLSKNDLIFVMRRFCFILFVILLIGQAYTAWLSQARWPFHSLYMFIGQYTIQANKILVQYTPNGLDYFPLKSERIKPYGNWQLRFNILSKNRQNQLSPFTDHLLKYNKANNAKAFKNVQKIRISFCEDFQLENCRLVAESQ